MLYVYNIRHAPDHDPVPEIPNEKAGLTKRGEIYAHSVMAPALRKDIDTILRQHPGEDYSLELFYSPTLRTRQVKDALVQKMGGLHITSQTEVPELLNVNMGKFYGLTKQQCEERFPEAAWQYNLAMRDPTMLRGIAKAPGEKAESENDVMARVRPFLFREKMRELDPEGSVPSVRIKIFVGHGITCQEIHRSFLDLPGQALIKFRGHIPGSIHRMSGPLPYTMQDDGFVLGGTVNGMHFPAGPSNVGNRR